MTMLANVSGQTLKVKGVTIGPRELKDVEGTRKELANHLFVRTGILEMSKNPTTTTGKNQAQQPEKESEKESE